MPYATTSALELAAGGAERFRQLTEDNDEAVEAALIAAQVWMDAELGKRFAVPLADEIVPASVAQLAAEEAIFILKRRKDMVTDYDQMAHEERAKALRDIATGQITFGTAAPLTKSSLVVDRQSERPTSKAVSRKKLEGFS